MSRIVCGWCGHPTVPGTCVRCDHDPALPWLQRGRSAPVVQERDGRPALRPQDVADRLAAARAALARGGRPATVDALAEALDVSPRTVRRWQEMAG